MYWCDTDDIEFSESLQLELLGTANRPVVAASFSADPVVEAANRRAEQRVEQLNRPEASAFNKTIA
jgi:hypothetical protein